MLLLDADFLSDAWLVVLEALLDSELAREDVVADMLSLPAFTASATFALAYDSPSMPWFMTSATESVAVLRPCPMLVTCVSTSLDTVSECAASVSEREEVEAATLEDTA